MSPRGVTDLDSAVRTAAFGFLEEHAVAHGDSISWATMLRGFQFRGERVVLASQQGIFKPRILSDYPISVRTTASKPGQPRPYDDGFQEDGTVTYKYRGSDPAFYQNVWLRRAMIDRVPLIYFHGTVPGRYIAAWPVYVIGDEPEQLTFRIDVDGRQTPSLASPDQVAEPGLARRYAAVTTRRRLHQQAFRDRVLTAYREHCAVCRLRHVELLDAAHIIPDRDPEGEPRVSNGLSLCKLHHAAFDQQLFGINPDLQIAVASAVLEERDGPMLRHGLQEIDGSRLLIPGRAEWMPDTSALERRYAEFLQATE